MPVRHDQGLLRKEDFLAIENVLYKQVLDEMVARQIAHVNSSYATYSREIGYDYYTRTGSAVILAQGASAKDLPFVGEDGGRITQKVFAIATGIRFTLEERLAFQARSSLGKGPVAPMDTLRIETARRYISETENRLFFVGDAKYGIVGLLNHPEVIVQDVAQGTTGADAAAKRLWSNKTPKEILKDILTAKTAIEGDGLFKSKILVMPPTARLRLLQPYSDLSPITVQQWLESNGAYFEKIIETRSMLAAYNGFGVDAFCLLDDNREVLELAVIEDLSLRNPVYDILETSEQAVIEKTAGAIIRHPTAIYIGKGI